MKIIIYAQTSTLLDGIHIGNLESKSLGGADRNLIQLMDRLSVYAQVKVYGAYRTIEKINNNLECLPFMDVYLKNHECDLLIIYRKLSELPRTIEAKKTIFYSEDMPDSPCFNEIEKDPRYFDNFDLIISLSKFHKKALMDSFDIPEDRIRIIGNYVEVRPYYKAKIPQRFIYGSTPFRGLDVLCRMWKDIKERIPNATLEVYSSMKIYGADEIIDKQFEPMYNSLNRMEGVAYKGSVDHSTYLDALDKAHVLLYPNVFDETYCNVLMEARASETIFVTSNTGALPETGGKAGIYIEGNARTKEYQDAFIDALEFIMSSKIQYNYMLHNCYPVRGEHDFSSDIHELMRELE